MNSIRLDVTSRPAPTLNVLGKLRVTAVVTAPGPRRSASRNETIRVLDRTTVMVTALFSVCFRLSTMVDMTLV